MSLLDKLQGKEQPDVPVHPFFSALVGLADGQLTRAEIETAFGIETTGTDATELDFLINTYTGIVADDFSVIGNANTRAAFEQLSVRIKQRRYLDAVHSIFMLTEVAEFNARFSKAELQAWLTAAAS